MRKRVLGMILAGGRGDRLQPLTRHRTKPAVPFGGLYRIIDFVLSNFVNSGVKSIYVLTQFKSQSLSEHLQRAWMGTNLWPGHFIVPVPAQMQTAGAVWYQGTADAIYQNLNLIREAKPDLVCIFGSDHIYRMDLAQMLRTHTGNEADVTIASIPVTREEGRRFGVIETDSDLRIQGFHEKVDEPPAIPGDPNRCLASMGNYVFGREVLEELLVRDAEQQGSSHDFGKDILPGMVEEGRRVFAYDFATNVVPGIEGINSYWRDIGTLEAYYDAAMDLTAPVPQLDLANNQWPVHRSAVGGPPTRMLCGGSESSRVIRTVMGTGNQFLGCDVTGSVLSRNTQILNESLVEGSILMDDVVVGAGCKLRRAILDKNVVLPPGTEVGYNASADRERGWHVTETGITVICKEPATKPITTLDL